MNTEKKQMVEALRAATARCRPLVEGPNVKFEVKTELRKLCTLAEGAAALLDESEHAKEK